MNADERDKLLDLHREAMRAMESFVQGDVDANHLHKADDAFRDYLMRLEITQ